MTDPQHLPESEPLDPDAPKDAATLRATTRSPNRTLALGLIGIALVMLAGAVGVALLVNHVAALRGAAGG